MTKLCDIFCQHAASSASTENMAQQTGTSTASTAAEGGSLTLEFRDTPFTSFMRRVKDMINSDPKEALRLILNAKEAKLFDRPHQKERIKDAMTRVLDTLHREQPQGLVGTFFRSVLDLPAPAPEILRQPHNPGQHHRPAFMAPALGLNPAPAIV